MGVICDDLCTRFVYRAEKSDRWTIMDEPIGPLYGDCDDFALTALWLMAGRSWVRILWLVATFQACLWYTRSPRGGVHMMLWVRGHGWIDNWPPRRFGVRRYPRIVPVILPLFLMALVIKRVR